MPNRRTEYAVGGFLLLVFLVLIGWNLAITYSFPVYTFTGLVIGIFGFYILGVVMRTSS